jgi:hypothetical protein
MKKESEKVKARAYDSGGGKFFHEYKESSTYLVPCNSRLRNPSVVSQK